jgi:hypothetical protein
MPKNRARTIPDLEAFKSVLSLRKESVSLCNGLLVRKSGKLLDSLDMPAAHKIASHAVTPTVKREFALSLKVEARLLSVIDIDDADYSISSRAENLINIPIRAFKTDLNFRSPCAQL